MRPITPSELSLWQTSGFAHTLVDVRRAGKRKSEADNISGGQWLDPALWLDWKDRFANANTPVVLYCAMGHEISQGLAAALRALNADARHLQGGIDAWRQAGGPVAPIS
jgi:thiosulfate sulfurtransferase